MAERNTLVRYGSFCNRLIFSLLLTISCFSSYAQFGHEWISSGNTYYKFGVRDSGLYALPFTQLNAAGINTSDPARIQLWRRGVEQAIHIANSTVYFYGVPNDGQLDSLLYRPYSSQVHKYYSLYTDTACYFITVGSTAGKRMANVGGSVSSGSGAYHLKNKLILYTNEYDRGTVHGLDTRLTHGDIGEGWFGAAITGRGSGEGTGVCNVPAGNLYTSGPLPKLQVMLVGKNSFDNHNVSIEVGNNIATYSLPFFSERNISFFSSDIPVSAINGGNLKVTIHVKGSPTDLSQPDAVAIAYVRLIYPSQNDISGATEYYFNSPSASDNYLELTNVPANAVVYDLTDLNNISMVNASYAGSTLGISLPAASQSLYLNNGVYKTISSLTLADLTVYPATADYLIVTHWKLLSNATIYANYRESVAGGGYDVLLAEVTKLYDLFTYGDKSPIAIRRFCDYQVTNGNAEYLFLIGKGLYVDHMYVHPGGYWQYYRKDPTGSINNPDPYWDLEDLIPPYGAPGSDVMYSEGLGTYGDYVPALATGRYLAKTDASVGHYYDKVTVHESLSDDLLWRKNLVHLSGGKDAGEIIGFRTFVNTLKTRAESPWFGGKVVLTLSKSVTSGTIDQTLKFPLANQVNQGVSYVTFFGHSSSTLTDVELGNVSDPILGYQNEGKYPMMIANGCLSAASFYSYSFAEDWMVTPKKGAIALLGHTDIGYSGSLQMYSQILYKINFNDTTFRNKPIGKVIQKVVDSFLLATSTTAPGWEYNVSTVTQMLLHGDPALRMYQPAKTDYHISGDNEIGDYKVFIHSYDGSTVTAISDSFAIGIPIVNFGVTDTNDIVIHVKRIVNGSTTIEYPDMIVSPIHYRDTVYFLIRSKDAAFYGQNAFEITVDYGDHIEEMNEMNNFATLNYFMPLAGVNCLFPREYSIVYNSADVTLVAQATNLMLGPTNFFIECSTDHTFSGSGYYQSSVITSGSLIQFPITLATDLDPSDSLVYYWRVRLNTIAPGEDTLWATSSFIYIKPSEPGWSQSEWPQFTKDGTAGIHLAPDGSWAFDEREVDVYAEIKGAASGDDAGFPEAPVLQIDGQTVLLNLSDNCWTQHGIMVVVFDRSSGQIKRPEPSWFYCGFNSKPLVLLFHNIFVYDDGDHTDPIFLDQVDMINYLDMIEEGDYVMIFNQGNAYYDSWAPTLKAKIEEVLGAQKLDDVTNRQPYFLFGKKGQATPIQELHNFSLSSTLVSDTSVNVVNDTAYVTSTLIGPVTDQWHKMYRKVVKDDPSDTYKIQLILHDLNAIPQDTIDIPQVDSLDLGPLVDFTQHPYIKLLAQLTDVDSLTAPQLERWQVIYKPAPEGCMDPLAIGANEYIKQTKQEGESITLRYSFKNIYDYDFKDSMKVRFTVFNSVGGIKKVETITVGPALKVGESIEFSYTFVTAGMVGENVLQAFMNPMLQAEQYYNNNVLEVAFSVDRDKTNPVLDVTFDDVHIMDGDIVSPSPQIVISLNDNNKVLLIDDPSSVSLFLLRPGQTVSEEIVSSNPDVVKWGQDPGKSNLFTLTYHPKNLPDGVYTIILKGKDKSNNPTGIAFYQIRFEVVNQSTITHFYPYPNPFSSSCRFVFTLTGGEIPEDIKIQIMTVTGKVVKEITGMEIGPIHAGNNITEYSWDGRDEFGDQLANGVYLYRVIIKNKGDNFEHRETAGDKAFKKEFGKLYILR